MAGFVALNAEKQMNTETTLDQGTPSPEPEVKQVSAPTEIKPGVVEPEATDPAAPEGDESEAKPEKTAEQKELERLRRQLTKAQRNNGKLHQEAQTYRQQVEQLAPRESQETSTVDPRQLAREMADLDKINERADAIADAGKTKYPDFFASLKQVVDEAGDLFDSNGKLTPLGNAIYEADVPAEDLIEFLGKNPDLASELEGLSPTKLGRKFAAIEAQMKSAPPKPVSKASEPISPIRGGAGNVVKTLENMSMAEYKAAREKQGAKWAR